MSDLKIKVASFFSRIFRFFVFSTLLSFGTCIVLIVGNLFAGVSASISVYLILFFIFDCMLTLFLTIYNSEKLFVPLSKPLIMKLERERLVRARNNNNQKKRKFNKKIS